MEKSNTITGPDCIKCGKPMKWHGVELAASIPMNIFKCEGCDQLSAAPAMAKVA